MAPRMTQGPVSSILEAGAYLPLTLGSYTWWVLFPQGDTSSVSTLALCHPIFL